MKKLLLLFVILGCTKTKETGCFEINKKYTGDEVYYFEWTTKESGTVTKLKLVSGEVTEEVYNQYKVGDTYCAN